MEKRYIFIGMGIILLVLSLILLFIPQEKISEETLVEIQEAEISLEENKIIDIANIHPKYENIQLEYYYKYDYCSDTIEKADKFFDSVEIIKNEKIKRIDKSILEKLNLDSEENINLPIVIFKGNADLYDSENNYVNSEDFKVIISGFSACSEKILIYNLCSYLKESPELCSELSFQEQYKTTDKSMPSDFICYESCNIRYNSGGMTINQFWQGPPCNRAKEYIEGESKVINNQCYGKNSCKSKEKDLGCCLESQCVNDGKCHKPLTALDVDSDGQEEVCVNINNLGFWVNADVDKEVCSANFKWFDCVDNECKQGIDNYDKKENGLCCGDDKNEQATKCEGKICDIENSEDLACCSENSCVYNGQCYQSGCIQLKLNSQEEVNVYCDNGRWVDLDDNYCSKCLGKKAWSGLVCCGDDKGEGRYPTRFVFNNENGANIISYDFCTNNKNNCVFPEGDKDFVEGCYQFNNNKYLDGGYYCSKSQWYDLDNNSDFCQQCGFNWNDNCCGDDDNENYIVGADNTAACCSNPTDIVVDGQCFPTVTCGNGKVESGEQCETSNSLNNEFCQQPTEQCFGNKLGTRDSFGNCEADCSCSEDEFEFACVKDVCGAGCGTNADCGIDEVCDQTTCSCRKKVYCGDSIIQEKNDDNWNEKCELPNTIFNPYCNETTQCFGIKTGIRYEYGSCDNNCQCSYVPFQKICVKGSCGAECNEDGTGCYADEICDTNTCDCIKSDVICGNNVCETGEEYSCPKDCVKLECPYRIDIEFDKTNYYENDTMDLKVYVYDKNNNLMPNVDFDLDIVANNNYVNTFTYTTSSLGSYERKRKITSFTPSGRYEYIAYVAKTKRPDCNIVGDSANAFIHVRKPAPISINLSRYEIVFKEINLTYSSCGNNIIEPGEVCEGSGICRVSAGCNYETRIYDIPEACNGCSCPADLTSKQDDEIYCNNCNACGDGIVNCNEQCETGTKETGNFCRDGKLYSGVDICRNCQWQDDGLENDVLISDCFCKFPESPNICDDGNFIEYPESYYAGCSNGECNECKLEDVYTKDTDNDGIEDKCDVEVCDNGIDDNDNGLIDMEDPQCSICENCGLGNFNLCDRNECLGFAQTCYFNEKIFNYGSCYECSSATCEDYGNDKVSCTQDSCSLGNCYWNGNSCCIDNDNDDICDAVDNCPNVYNPNQENSDEDKRGDACEVCIYEPLLFEPAEQKELNCNDGIDNDCDNLVDCQDVDCAGIENCCQRSLDCEQNNCVIESCVNNQCSYNNRNLCDNTECPSGSYCDFSGNCAEPETSEDVCLVCINDKTKYDGGIGFASDLFNMDSNFNMGACCGNQENEYYLIQEENNQAACCDSATDCIDYLGNCIDSNSPNFEGHLWHCSISKWYECSENIHALCAEAGSTYKQDIEYKANKETGWYCTYDNSWAWRSKFPKEVCDDNIDNDCDGLVDINDTDCPIKNQENNTNQN
jgi:hypothetical protein